MRRALSVGFLTCLALLVGWVAAQVLTLAAFDQESAADRRNLHAQIADVEAANVALAEQVRALGDIPVAEVDGSRTPTIVPLQGPRGIPGVTGPRGPRGTTGVGTPGRAGADGTDGATGATGAAGPKGDTGPAGKDGANGKDGQPGKDGRGIASITCADSGDWIIGLTDGTSLTVTGPCRVPPASTEPPTP